MMDDLLTPVLLSSQQGFFACKVSQMERNAGGEPLLPTMLPNIVRIRECLYPRECPLGALGAGPFCCLQAAHSFLLGRLRIEPKVNSEFVQEELERVTKEGASEASDSYRITNSFDRRANPFALIRNFKILSPRGALEKSDTLGEYLEECVGKMRSSSLRILKPRTDCFKEVLQARLCRDLTGTPYDGRNVVLMISRPPEAVMVFRIASSDEEGKYHYAIYDPFPRPQFGVFGAALYRYKGIGGVGCHLYYLFPACSVERRGMPSLEDDQYNSAYAFCFVLKREYLDELREAGAPVPAPLNPEICFPDVEEPQLAEGAEPNAAAEAALAAARAECRTLRMKVASLENKLRYSVDWFVIEGG